MSGLKRKEEEIGLIDLDADKADDSRKEQASKQKAREQRAKAVRMAFAGMVAGGLALMLLGTMVFQISLITVGFVVVIEAVIASALNNSPFWVHIGIMALQVCFVIFFYPKSVFCTGGRILFFTAVSSKVIGG